uniref:G-protein coupled receptors family 1 profile domain-containing protein n=2 Tax=Clytia hemisphaerica TaxID=252671 RepID=A0A7M5X0P4_9CNID
MENVIVASILAMETFACIILNFLIVIALIKDPLKKLRNMFNFLLIHLCLCDLAASLFSFPLVCYSLFTYDDQKSNKNIKIGILIANPLLNAGIFTTMLLSYDRYKAITNPIEYRQNVNMNGFLKYIGLVWMYSLSILIFALTVKSEIAGFIIDAALNTPEAVVLAIMYYRVRKIFKARTNCQLVENLITSSQLGKSQRLEKDKHATNTITLIFVMQMLTVLSIFAQDVYVYLNGENNNNPIIFWVSTPLNVLADPIICITRMPDFKKSVKALFSVG